MKNNNFLPSSLSRFLIPVFGIGISYGIWDVASRNRWLQPAVASQSELTVVVKRTSMPITVVAGGELQSAQSVSVFSEVEGQQIKIVEMVPEGTFVKAGMLVMELDPSEVKRLLSEQEIKLMKAETAVKTATQEVNIQQNLAETALANASLAKTLAELDLRKYLDGDHQVALSDLKGQIALAESGFQEAEVMVESFQKLSKKGFKSPQQLRAKEQDLARARYALARDKQKLFVLEKFTFDRQNAELTVKAAETVRVLQRLESNAKSLASKALSDLYAAETTERWEKSQLEKFKKQLENCKVKSPHDGIVVYAKQEGKRVELGATAHFKQELFSLPDVSRMQVKAFVHESALRRIQSGQSAEIRIDAFRDVVMNGSVDKIDSFYDSVRHWTSGGVKEYSAIVKIDNLPPNNSFKPGMSANLQINVGQIKDSLVVPLPAVAEQEGKYVSFVVSGQQVQRREVTLGEITESLVEIVDGLNEGEVVMMNARFRLTAEVRTSPSESTNRLPDELTFGNPSETPPPINPTPESINPTPPPINPTPESINPTPESINPTPPPINPTPPPINPAPASINPTPE